MPGEHLLVIESDRTAANIIAKDVLQPKMYHVHCAASGEEALKIMQTVPPDLILLSIESVPDDYLSLLQQLNAPKEREKTPIILLSSQDIRAISIDVLRTGVCDHLTKPINTERLLTVIDDNLSTTRLKLENEALTTYVLRSNRQLEMRLKEIDVISQVGKSVSAIRDMNELLPLVVDAAALITHAEEGRIFLVENGRLMCRAEKLHDKELANSTRTETTDKLAHRVIDSGQPLILSPEDSAETNDGPRSAAYVPLMANGKVNGVISINNVSDSAHIFSGHESHLLDMLTDYVAVAIENSHNFDRMRQTKELESAQIRDSFERFVPPSVVAQILTDPNKLELGGTRQEVSILFADIRGFTSWSEHTAPEKVMTMLNDYLSLAAGVILAWEGTLDKFMGDGLMAIFNAPEAQDDHVHRAIDAALALLQAAEESNKKSGHNLTYSVGVHVGEAVVGYLGTERAMNYTAIGDSVNLAKRLQETAPPGKILVADTTVQRLGDMIDVEAHGEVTVKGRTQPTTVYRLTGARSIA